MKIKPQLVKDITTGKICMQVHLGSHTATLPLPEKLAGATAAELQIFFNEVAPEMIRGLKERQREESKKIMKMRRKIK